jgi:hypothetical protein
MNVSVARDLLLLELSAWRTRSYAELVKSIRHTHCAEATGVDGKRYQIEVEVFWDSKPGGAVRVMGAIDDGGFRAFRPHTEDFIMAPDGSFIGES